MSAGVGGLPAIARAGCRAAAGTPGPAGAPIGENCTLEHNITLGIAGKGDERGLPAIGNRVYIGAHSIIVYGLARATQQGQRRIKSQ
ncbi:MAG: hypothetical protein ACT4P4_07140 [Betaproteobacteria bacterium]